MLQDIITNIEYINKNLKREKIKKNEILSQAEIKGIDYSQARVKSSNYESFVEKKTEIILAQDEKIKKLEEKRKNQEDLLIIFIIKNIDNSMIRIILIQKYIYNLSYRDISRKFKNDKITENSLKQYLRRYYKNHIELL